MNFLSLVDRLGEELKNSPDGQFSNRAFNLLRQNSFHKYFSQDLLPELRIRHKENLSFLEHDCVFSDECLVLYVNDLFTIEVYHWLYSDTGIHDHNFQGAFQCLEGEDHQVEFEFIPERTVFEGLDEGQLKEINRLVLKPGDTQEIKDRDHFIHAVAHSPSTWNLCVRTKGNQAQILKAYHVKGFSYALDRAREERLKTTSDYRFEEMDSPDLLHLFHLLGYQTGNFEKQKSIDLMLRNRHSIAYLEITNVTSNYLNQLGRTAKNY